VGYVFAIRSERLICREVQVNLPIAGSTSSASKMCHPGPFSILACPQRAFPRVAFRQHLNTPCRFAVWAQRRLARLGSLCARVYAKSSNASGWMSRVERLARDRFLHCPACAAPRVVTASGPVRRFFYETPRKELKAAGVAQGVLLTKSLLCVVST
jgi:hypothetical protein